jgi:hypothetical protein
VANVQIDVRVNGCGSAEIVCSDAALRHGQPIAQAHAECFTRFQKTVCANLPSRSYWLATRREAE